jgi:uncharacterized protein (TIGR02421 family)
MRAGVDPLAEADRLLSKIAESFDYLLVVTPSNGDEALEEFEQAGFAREPSFVYPPPAVDVGALRSALARVPLDELADPDLARLFDAKRREIGLWLDLPEHLGTPAFLEASVELYGAVDDDLLAMAELVLDGIPRDERGEEPGGDVRGDAWAALARAEVERYRSSFPSMPTQVLLDPAFPGVMVSGADVIVGPDHLVANARADALVHHEVGTHVVTNVNGSRQPLRLLGAGLPGYEETQEGLAVFAEYLVGGLTPPRLALLAARVLAARRLTDGAGFAQVYAELVDGVGLRRDRAWDVTMRTWRGGGLTKDLIYLRGLARVVHHVATGGALEPLTIGKLDLADVPVAERLLERGVLEPPRLRPRWLDHALAPPLLEAARGGQLVDLLPGMRRAI